MLPERWTRPPVHLAGPWATLLAGLALACGLNEPAATQTARALLVASVLLLGLPHGAGDWWIMRRAAGTSRARLAAWVAGYVAAAVATVGFWWWRPGVALAGFLALTAWHFGTADASVLLANGGPPWRGRAWWLFGVGRGLVVVFAPLAWRPVEAARVLEPFAVLDPAPGGLPVVGSILRTAPFLLWLGVGWSVAGTLCQGRRAAWLLMETAGLLALFWFAPPLLGFVCYWMGFHCWRHLWRVAPLALSSGEEHFPPPGLARTLAIFHWRSLPLTLLSLLGFAGIFALWPALKAGGGAAVVAYLILLSALTVPHAAVIGWLDWKTEGGRRKAEGRE